jgi:hypothetical protein
MAKAIRVQVLERARALIADKRHWCTGQFALDAHGYAVDPTGQTAVRRCAVGALIAAAHEITTNSALAHELAATSTRPVVGATALTHINDAEGHSAVLDLIDQAIAAS